MRVHVGLLLALLVVAAPATAQVKNPTLIEFTSDDHARLTAYEVDIVRTDGSVAQTLVILANLAAAQPDGSWRLAVNVQPTAFGNYTFRVRAVADTVKSDNSALSDVWQRAPGTPSKPVVK